MTNGLAPCAGFAKSLADPLASPYMQMYLGVACGWKTAGLRCESEPVEPEPANTGGGKVSGSRYGSPRFTSPNAMEE